MRNAQAPGDNELYEIVDARLTAMMLEMEEADWNTAEVAFAIRDVLKAKWLDEAEALQAARKAVPDNFVSDGNEG